MKKLIILKLSIRFGFLALSIYASMHFFLKDRVIEALLFMINYQLYEIEINTRKIQ